MEDDSSLRYDVLEVLGTLRTPDVKVVDVIVSIHAAVLEAAALADDTHIWGSPNGRRAEMAERAERESLRNFAGLFRRLWDHRIDEIGTSIGITSAAQCHPNTTTEEVHELSAVLYQLNTSESCILGDALLAAARATYACVLPTRLHANLCQSWADILEKHGLPHQYRDLVAYCEGCFPGVPPCTHGMSEEQLEAVCAAWIHEEVSNACILTVDVLGAMQEWYARRGFAAWDVSAVPTGATVAALRSARESGAQMMLCGAVDRAFVPAVKDLLGRGCAQQQQHGGALDTPPGKGGAAVAAATLGCADGGSGSCAPPSPSFRVVITSAEPSSGGLIEMLRGTALPVVNAMGPAGCAHFLLPSIVQVLDSELHASYMRTSQAVRDGERLLREAQDQLLRAITASPDTQQHLQQQQQQPSSASASSRQSAAPYGEGQQQDGMFLKGIRGMIAHRKRSLSVLRGLHAKHTERVDYFYPVAARACQLKEWLAGRLAAADFKQALASRLSAHLVRPPTILFDTEKFDEEVSGLADTVVSSSEGLRAFSSVEASLRMTPQVPKLHATCIAYSLTSSLLSIPLYFAEVLSRAHTDLKEKRISKREYSALLMHHPVRQVCETELAKECQKNIAVISATCSLMHPGGGAAGEGGEGDGLKQLTRWVEFIGRAKEMRRRWEEGQRDEVRSLVLLAAWAASHHCKQDFVDRGALKTYGDELARLCLAVDSATESMAESLIQNTPGVMTLFRKIVGQLAEEVQALSILVSRDVHDGYVYDLDAYLDQASALKERQRRLVSYEGTLGVCMVDKGGILDLEAILAEQNYTVSAGAAHHTTLPQSNEKMKTAKTLNKLLHIDESQLEAAAGLCGGGGGQLGVSGSAAAAGPRSVGCATDADGAARSL